MPTRYLLFATALVPPEDIGKWPFETRHPIIPHEFTVSETEREKADGLARAYVAEYRQRNAKLCLKDIHLFCVEEIPLVR